MMLDGRIIAVTGAFGTLGKSVIRVARRHGATVAAIGRSAQSDAVDVGANLSIADVDLSNPEAADRCFARIAAELGGLDGLANVAGTFRWESIETGSAATWDFLYRANVYTALNASRAALPLMLKRGGGRIVNVGAAAAAKAGAGMGPYAASKAGVAKLTEALAAELKDRGVSVNAVLPSILDTPQNHTDMPGAEADRWVKPDALAEVIVFLLSAAGGIITGASIPVTGRT